MLIAHKLRVAFSLVVLTTVAVAGCGGSSVLSRRQAIFQADTICEQIEIKRASISASLGKLSLPQQLKEVARTAPAFSQEEYQSIERMRTLKVPASLAHDWRELLAGMQQLAAETARVGAAAGAGNGKGVESITASGQPIRERLERIAKRDGFKACGR